jgi:hypothetical protein
MSDEARDKAWDQWIAGTPSWTLTAGDGFDGGFEAGVREGIRQAREVAAPDFSKPSAMRRENYTREDIVAAIDNL